MRCLFELGILKAIPSHGSVTYGSLSRQLGLSQDVIERLCRFSSTFGFLQSGQPGRVEHSATSKLAIDNAIAVGFNMQHFPFSTYLLSDALRLDSNAREPCTCAFALSQRKGDSRSDEPLLTLWQVLDSQPMMAAAFAECMQFVNQSSQLGSAWIQDAFDWSKLPPGATIVDVGGGRGHVMLALAEKFPNLKYIVQDKMEMINGMYTRHSAGKASNLNSVSFMPHDFFEPQLARGEVFFFRKVFHDWSDAYCERILRALGPALKPGVKLIVNDIVLPEPNGRPNYAEYVARRMDMAMMVMVNGKQRTLCQWQALICGAQARWQLESVKTQEGSLNGLLVFTYW